MRTTRLVFLFDLAPGGVYHAAFVTKVAVRSYHTISPLPEMHMNTNKAVYFLLHWPWAHAPRTLSGTLSCGARTFLELKYQPAIARPTQGCIIGVCLLKNNL